MKEEKTEGVLLSLPPELRNSRRDTRSFTRKPSTESLPSRLSTKEKILPHYLTASAGSCHDFCKYGGNHTHGSNGRASSFPLPSKQQNLLNAQSLAVRQRKSPLRQKATAPNIGSHSSKKNWGKKAQLPVKTFKISLASENIKENISSPEISASYAESGIKGRIRAPLKEGKFPEGLKSMKKDAHRGLGSCDDSASVNKNAPSLMKKTEASRNSETAGLKKHSAHNSFENFEPQIRQKSLLSTTFRKPSLSGKAKVFKQEDASFVKKIDASSKPATSGKSNASSLKSESLQRPTTGMKGGNSRRKIVKTWNLVTSGPRRNLKSPSASLFSQSPVDHIFSKCKSAKSNFPVWHPKTVRLTELGGGKLRERTQYVTGPTVSAESRLSSGQPSLSSPHSSSSPSFSDHEEGEYQDSESGSSEMNDMVFEQGGDETNTTPRTGGERHHGTVSTAHPADGDGTLCELKIRRGKMLNLQPENYVTGRLSVRQTRSTGGSRSGEGEMKRIRFKASEPTNSNRIDAEAESVELRHRDVQDKKGTLVLFNHVIEETASKLAETRKSKVKALVGAFETVISLQGRKSADSSM